MLSLAIGCGTASEFARTHVGLINAGVLDQETRFLAALDSEITVDWSMQDPHGLDLTPLTPAQRVLAPFAVGDVDVSRCKERRLCHSRRHRRHFGCNLLNCCVLAETTNSEQRKHREDGNRLSTKAPTARSRSHDHAREAARPPPLEDGVGVPPPGSRGERVLPVQVDPRGGSPCPDLGRADGRSTARVQHLESDDRPRQASVVRDRSMREPGLGTVRSVSESCTNAASDRRRLNAPKNEASSRPRNRENTIPG